MPVVKYWRFWPGFVQVCGPRLASLRPGPGSRSLGLALFTSPPLLATPPHWDKTQHVKWHWTHEIIISDNWKYIWSLLKNYFWHICQVTAMSLQRRASVAGADFKKDYLNRSGERYNLIWILYDKTDLQDNLSKVHHIVCPCKVIKSYWKIFSLSSSNKQSHSGFPFAGSCLTSQCRVMTIDCDRPPLSPVLQDVWLLSSSGPGPA